MFDSNYNSFVFVKCNNIIYQHFDLSGMDMNYQFSDLIPYTEDDNNMSVSMGGVPLQPGVTELDRSVQEITLHIVPVENRINYICMWDNSVFNIYQERDLQLVLGMGESIRGYVMMTADFENHLISAKKYIFSK